MIMLALYPFSARAATSALDPLRISLSYGAGIAVILVFFAGGFFISRKIRHKLDKYNRKIHEKTCQSREPAWKSDLQDAFAVQEQAGIGAGQEKDEEKSPET